MKVSSKFVRYAPDGDRTVLQVAGYEDADTVIDLLLDKFTDGFVCIEADNQVFVSVKGSKLAKRIARWLRQQ